MPTTNEKRKENLYWVRQRDKWRAQYKNVRDEIVYCKQEVAHQHKQGQWWTANRYLVQLKALQQFANVMMIERQYIKAQLKVTSYRYE